MSTQLRTTVLIKHVSVEHNGGGCPLHLFSNSNCFLRFPIPPVSTPVCSPRNLLHYNTLHFTPPVWTPVYSMRNLLHYNTLHFIPCIVTHCVTYYITTLNKTALHNITFCHHALALKNPFNY